MAISIVPIGIDAGSHKYILDSDSDATSEDNINGGPGTIKNVFIDNSANAAISYVKFYDSASAVTVGTTVPDMILPCNASSRYVYSFKNGVFFQNGIGVASVTAAGTAGTTSPTSDVVIYIEIE